MATGRWDFLADQKPRTLQAFVLDQVADALAAELRAFPPTPEWLDEAARARAAAVLARPDLPPAGTLRVACALAREELLRDFERIDRFLRSEDRRAVLPTPLEEDTALFLSSWLVEAALSFREHAQGRFSRADLVALLERVEDRVLDGFRFRL